eukprot:274978-Rhodomonas_salina.2
MLAPAILLLRARAVRAGSWRRGVAVQLCLEQQRRRRLRAPLSSTSPSTRARQRRRHERGCALKRMQPLEVVHDEEALSAPVAHRLELEGRVLLELGHALRPAGGARE